MMLRNPGFERDLHLLGENVGCWKFDTKCISSTQTRGLPLEISGYDRPQDAEKIVLFVV